MMSPIYLQQFDPWVTQVRNNPTVYSTTSSAWDDVQPTVTTACSQSNYYEYPYTPKYEETAKEKKIRQAAAFSSFYKSGGFTPRKSAKTIRAEQKERMMRESKFKSLNNNLIL